MMIDRWNILVKYIYLALIVVPIVFLLISIGSYLSVYSAFGDLPSTGADFDVNEGSIPAFPANVGKIIMVTFFICLFIAMPAIMIINGVFAIVKRRIVFQSKPALMLFAMNALALSLIFTDLAGWYVGFVLT